MVSAIPFNRFKAGQPILVKALESKMTVMPGSAIQAGHERLVILYNRFDLYTWPERRPVVRHITLYPEFEVPMTTFDPNNLKIENNESAHRWEAHIGDYVAFSEYRRNEDTNTIHFLKTRVPPELEGQGIAGKLVKAALEDARAQHLTVVPICRFVASYIRRHAEYRDLVFPDFRHLVDEKPN